MNAAFIPDNCNNVLWAVEIMIVATEFFKYAAC